MGTTALGALILGLVVTEPQPRQAPEFVGEVWRLPADGPSADSGATVPVLVVASLDREPLSSPAPVPDRLDAAVQGAIAFSGAVGPGAGAEASIVTAASSLANASAAPRTTIELAAASVTSTGADTSGGGEPRAPSDMLDMLDMAALASVPRQLALANFDPAPRTPGRIARGTRPQVVSAEPAQLPPLIAGPLVGEHRAHRPPTVRIAATDATVEPETGTTDSVGASERDPRLAMEQAAERLEVGDIAAARALLMPIATPDHPDAILALAETYDPIILSRHEGAGKESSPGRAVALYSSVADLVGSAYPPLRARLEAANPLVIQAVLPVVLGEANAMVARGDIRSARELLAATARFIASAEVALAMARTFDPSLLARVPGGAAMADVVEAEAWYRKWQGLAIDEGSLSESANVDAIIRAMRRQRIPSSAGGTASEIR